MINRVRYGKILSDVYSILKLCGISSYPIDLFRLAEIYEKSGYFILLDSYANYAKFKNITPLELSQKVFHSDDGVVLYHKQMDFYFIFYNESISSKGRVRWTIAHEIGHVVLDHHKMKREMDAEGLPFTKKMEKIFEKEADWFARSLLCHPNVLLASGFEDVEEISGICGISKNAALNRLSEMQHLRCKKPSVYDNAIAELFQPFISQR